VAIACPTQPECCPGGGGRLVEPRQVFVISGPSGVGKNTLARELERLGRAVRVVTATTRPPRGDETDGRDYHFVGEEEFLRWVKEGRLIEHARYVGHYYGTPVASVNRATRSGLPVMLTIDVEGGMQIKARWPQVTLVFVLPPSPDELGRRLAGRGENDAADVERRLKRALEECDYAERYDFRVVNDDVGRAATEIAQIMAIRWRPGMTDACWAR